MAPQPVVRISTLRFTWPGRTAACLQIPDLAVHSGERIFIHGASGSGKSTLLALLGGVLAPQEGSVQVLGTQLNALKPSRRDRFRCDHIGFIFQLFNLVPYLPVIDNVMLPCRFSTRRRSRAIEAGGSVRAEALRLLSHLDLDDSLLERSVTDLSVGQQQRVAAARALLGRPEIVVADEPTSALDADRQHAFLQLLMQECQAAGATLLFVSHDRRLAPQFTREVDLQAINRAHSRREAA
jgi:putative ABC transport system ATP-binding protein